MQVQVFAIEDAHEQIDHAMATAIREQKPCVLRCLSPGSCAAEGHLDRMLKRVQVLHQHLLQPGGHDAPQLRHHPSALLNHAKAYQPGVRQLPC